MRVTRSRDDAGRMPENKTNPVRGAAISLFCDIALPVAAYYVLRAFGVSEVWSLILSGVPPTLRVLFSLIRYRKLEGMGLFALTVLVLNLGTALVSGDARTLLIRSGWVSLPMAAWMLGSLFLARRPMTFQATVALLPGRAERLESLYRAKPGFRRVWRRLAVIWGITTLAGCGANIVMAYTLPVDSVPALDTLLQVGSFVLSQIATQIMLHREGTMRTIWSPGQVREGVP
jgi:intracellular septation protein A